MIGAQLFDVAQEGQASLVEVEQVMRLELLGEEFVTGSVDNPVVVTVSVDLSASGGQAELLA